MLNRVSINVILNSVIATLAAAVVIVLAFGAMSSWTRLAAVNRIVGRRRRLRLHVHGAA